MNERLSLIHFLIPLNCWWYLQIRELELSLNELEISEIDLQTSKIAVQILLSELGISEIESEL